MSFVELLTKLEAEVISKCSRIEGSSFGGQCGRASIEGGSFDWI